MADLISVQELTAKTETSLTIRWSSNAVINYVWYSTNNGSSYTGLSVTEGTTGSFDISGLSANTSYQVKTKVRRKSDNAIKESAAATFKTYAYPYANSTPSFTIGEKVNIGIYNPLNRTLNVKIRDSSDNDLFIFSGVSGTSITLDSGTTTNTNLLYNTIPNATSASYKVWVQYGGQSQTATGGTFKINTSIAVPSYTNINIFPTNNPAGFITKIIQGISALSFSISGVSGYKGSTISSVTVKVGNNTYTLTETSTSGTYNNSEHEQIIDLAEATAIFTITDSRGQKKTINRVLTIYEYFNPTAICTAQRANNYYSSTTLTVNPNIADIGGSNSAHVEYRYYLVGGTVSSWTSLSGDSVVLQLDNTKEWLIDVRVTDDFDSSFSGSDYYFWNEIVPPGLPIVFFDRKLSATGFNCFPRKTNDFVTLAPEVGTYPKTELDINLLLQKVYYDLTYDNGDLEEYGSSDPNNDSQRFFLTGMVSGGSKSVQFSLVTPKNMGDLDFEIESIKLNIRSEGVYLLGGSFVPGGVEILDQPQSDPPYTSPYAMQAIKCAGNIITFVITKRDTTAFNVANNSVISVAVENLIIQFLDSGGD